MLPTDRLSHDSPRARNNAFSHPPRPFKPALSFGIDWCAPVVYSSVHARQRCPTTRHRRVDVSSARHRRGSSPQSQEQSWGASTALTMSKEPEPEGKTDESKDPETDPNDLSPADVKIILLGDSAVGKTKLVERFLMDEYNPQQLSTYALTMFRKNLDIDGKNVKVDIWDTAGQERFNKMHPAYYHRAHACILCFDVTRKATYQHLGAWYDEMRDACENIPCILVANKIDIDYQVTPKNFKFASSKNIPFYFVLRDGTKRRQGVPGGGRERLDYKDNGALRERARCMRCWTTRRVFFWVTPTRGPAPWAPGSSNTPASSAGPSPRGPREDHTTRCT